MSLKNESSMLDHDHVFSWVLPAISALSQQLLSFYEVKSFFFFFLANSETLHVSVNNRK